ASHSSRDTPRGKAPTSFRSRPIRSASQTVSSIADQSDPLLRPPQTAPGSVETGAPTFPAAPPLPSSTAPAVPNGSKRPETSAFVGPVATSPASSIRLQPEAENRTTRVLPNPDNSCATDKSAPGELCEFYIMTRVG